MQKYTKGKGEKIQPLKSFDQRLKEGEIVDTERAASVTGYSVQHVRRLCASRKMDHLKRGDDYFFTPEMLAGVFKSVLARETVFKRVTAK